VAFSDNVCYLQPFGRILQEINKTLKPNRPSQLPSPFEIYASLAQYYAGFPDVERCRYLAIEFSMMAATVDVLQQSNKEPSWRSGILALSPADQLGLAKLICITGPSVETALSSSQQWLDSHGTEMDYTNRIFLPDSSGREDITRIISVMGVFAHRTGLRATLQQPSSLASKGEINDEKASDAAELGADAYYEQLARAYLDDHNVDHGELLRHPDWTTVPMPVPMPPPMLVPKPAQVPNSIPLLLSERPQMEKAVNRLRSNFTANTHSQRSTITANTHSQRSTITANTHSQRSNFTSGTNSIMSYNTNSIMSYNTNSIMSYNTNSIMSYNTANTVKPLIVSPEKSTLPMDIPPIGRIVDSLPLQNKWQLSTSSAPYLVICLVWICTGVASGAMGGIAAASVLGRLDRSLSRQDLLKKGAIGGAIISAFMCLHISYLVSFSVARNTGNIFRCMALILIISWIGCSVASTQIVTIAISLLTMSESKLGYISLAPISVLTEEGPGALGLAAAAAAAPASVDYIGQLVVHSQTYSSSKIDLHDCLSLMISYPVVSLVASTPWSALAGYTFARVANNLGKSIHSQCIPKLKLS
jgi:hypothetical protein